MLPLPTRFAGLIRAFAPLFVHRSWQHAQFLLIGAIPTPGRRTVASVLRIMGRADERRFVNVHRILNRAAWCPRTGGRILFGLPIGAFAPHGPVVLGVALFSIVTLLAARLPTRQRRCIATAAWYPNRARPSPSSARMTTPPAHALAPVGGRSRTRQGM